METITIVLPTIDQVEFETICSPEYCQIAGNASAVDEETDKQVIDWIESELESGNQWAWCDVEVKASWKGIEGSDFLGCCSYQSQEDFEKPGDYYDDMKQEAYAQLIKKIKALA